MVRAKTRKREAMWERAAPRVRGSSVGAGQRGSSAKMTLTDIYVYVMIVNLLGGVLLVVGADLELPRKSRASGPTLSAPPQPLRRDAHPEPGQ